MVHFSQISICFAESLKEIEALKEFLCHGNLKHFMNHCLFLLSDRL